MHNPVEDCFYAFNLPFVPESFPSAILRMEGVLSRLGYSLDEILSMLWEWDKAMYSWVPQNENEVIFPSVLERVLVEVLPVCHPTYGLPMSKRYVNIYKSLRVNHGLGHVESRMFLANSFLALDLAELYRHGSLSASKITDMLWHGQGPHCLWKATEEVLGIILENDSEFEPMRLILPETRKKIAQWPDGIENTFRGDHERSLYWFGEKSYDECLATLSRMLKLNGFPCDNPKVLLRTIFDNRKEEFFPHLIIFYYLLWPLENYDCKPGILYEYDSRGEAITWLRDQVPPAMVGTSQTEFLNNCKGHETVFTWAITRKPKEAPSAHAISKIMGAIGTLSRGSVVATARLFRAWFHYVMLRTRDQSVKLPTSVTKAEAFSLVKSVCQEPTRTGGRIEQAIGAAITSLAYPEENGWKMEGAGDSAYASGKLGDFCYINSNKVLVFEVHDGTLKSEYVEKHLSSCAKTVKKRRELNGFEVEVVFIARQIACEPVPQVFDGIRVASAYKTFVQVLEEVRENELLPEAVLKHVVKTFETPRHNSEKTRKVISRLLYQGLEADAAAPVNLPEQNSVSWH
jgi:hypothetical protein